MKLDELVPDAEVLLAMPAEELAHYVLRALPLNRHHSVSDVVLTQNLNGYPREKLASCQLVIAEAWQSLLNQGLLAPSPEVTQSPMYVVSRKGRTAQTEQGYADIQRAALFPSATLHPGIATSTFNLFIRGSFDTAVFEAFRAVEVAVRTAGGFAATDYGVPLMRKAFDPQSGPLTNQMEPPAERQALSDLFAGAIGRFKNPTSHRHVQITDPAEAIEMISFASHLLRLIP